MTENNKFFTQYWPSEMLNDRNGPMTRYHGYITTTVAGVDNTAITAVTGKKLRVVQAIVNANGTRVEFTIRSVTSATSISPLFSIGQDQTIFYPFNPYGYWETNTGESLGAIFGVIGTRANIEFWAIAIDP